MAKDTTLNSVAVMFSGGRDSSLAAVTYCIQGSTVHLLRFVTGIGIPSVLPDIRESELRARFGERIAPSTQPIPVQGLVRRIAIESIEDDFRNFGGKNLVLLGEKLALHAAGTVFCIRNNIGVLADGTSGYQSEMPEQRDVAVDFFRKFASRFDLRYETPVRQFNSADMVKYSLLEAGISTKSLEGLSMFADSFSRADDETIAAYLVAKQPIAVAYVERFTADVNAGRSAPSRQCDAAESVQQG